MNIGSLADDSVKKRTGKISADISLERSKVKRKQKGCSRRLTNDNGHLPFVASICCRLTS